MINRKHRFHGRGSLRFVYQRGEVVRSSFGVLRYVPNPRRKTYRLAVVVSKKVNRSAVVRNRIRRRLYELIRIHESEISDSFDMAFIVYSDQLATMEAPEFQQRVWEQFTKAGITGKTTDQ